MKKNIIVNKHINLLLAILLVYPYTSTAYSNQDELLNLSVEDLLNVEVISVSKKAKSLNDSPAAIYVISQDDIKRIGATSIPEALRLAPGIDVARVDSNKWAVTARGFNSRFANKLLVLIDGRSLYTQAFAGVYWESQDVMLEDVERIEVIRGPGATLWGANAVNGVINIITKHTADTQGSLLTAGGGTEEQGFGAFRYGGKLNDNTTARAYIKGFIRDESHHQITGDEAHDNWDKVQGGFRIDSQLTKYDALTIQGDAYRNTINQNTKTPSFTPPYEDNLNDSARSFGGNVLMRQQHTFSSTSDYSLQIFYDFYERSESYLAESRHVMDIDFQHRFSPLEQNDLLWGIGYRINHDDFKTPKSELAKVSPLSRNDQIFSAFLQDEITLIDNTLWLTLGSKFEHNDYSGFEIQPSARIMWSPHRHHRLWAGVSRAIKTVARTGHDLTLLQQVIPPRPPATPAVAIILSSDGTLKPEKAISYEIGYRTTHINNVSVDLTAFYNQYKDLTSFNPLTPFFNGSFIEQNLSLTNKYKSQTYGFEIATVWQMYHWWRWDMNYSLLKTEFSQKNANTVINVSPQQRASLRSAISPTKDIDLDLFFRYTDSATVSARIDMPIKAYVSMDIRLAWRPTTGLELSLVGQNLLAKQHIEYRQEFYVDAAQVDRGIYGKLMWQF